MEPKKAQVQQEVGHYSLRWDGGCASSMYVEKLVGIAVVKQLEMWTPVDLLMFVAGLHHGSQSLFSLEPGRVEEELHLNMGLSYQHLKNTRLCVSIPVHSLDQQIWVEGGPLLYLNFPLLEGDLTGPLQQVSKQYRTDFFQNIQVLLHHKVP